MDKGFSVIIPCYNVENKIEICMNSIVETGYENIEIILIDDCSTDSTNSVIEAYSKNSKLSVKCLKNEKNIGAGESRNRGIEYATKEYMTFVDADDCLSKDFFSELNTLLQHDDYDCIVFDAKTNDNKSIEMLYGKGFSEGYLSTREAFVFTQGTTWGKVYKSQIIKDNDICYANLKRNEDTVFTKVALSFCEKIYYRKAFLYIYCDNPDSLMHNELLLDKNNAIKAFELVKERMHSRDSFKEELDSLYLLEVVYSTTMTTLRQTKQIKDVKTWYKNIIAQYCKEQYSKRYGFKYKLILQLFRLNMFFVVKWILESNHVKEGK